MTALIPIDKILKKSYILSSITPFKEGHVLTITVLKTIDFFANIPYLKQIAADYNINQIYVRPPINRHFLSLMIETNEKHTLNNFLSFSNLLHQLFEKKLKQNGLNLVIFDEDDANLVVTESPDSDFYEVYKNAL